MVDNEADNGADVEQNKLSGHFMHWIIFTKYSSRIYSSRQRDASSTGDSG